MYRRVTLILLLFFCSITHGQDAAYLELLKAEKQLQLLFGRLYSDSLTDRDVLLEEIRNIMASALSMDGSMDFPWSGLDRIGVVTSDDEQVRSFTWHISEDPDHYRYFGYIQVARKRGSVDVFELEDRLEQATKQHIEQSVDNWHGKLYYRIITSTYRRNTYYTLLGMDFNNSMSTIKTVEVIGIRRNRPRFLEDMFYTGREQVDRMVFEYSNQVSMSVRYDPQLKMIIFDHLVPFHPIYQGDYKFYGPDGSFDGLEFEGGTWIYRDDVDARNRN